MSKLHPKCVELRQRQELLLSAKNEKTDFYNGIYERWVNPVLTRAHVPPFWCYDPNPETNPFMMQRLGINAAFNSGALLVDGKFTLVARVEGADRKSFFAVAQSDSGVEGFRFWDKPILLPDTCPEETNVYDMRLLCRVLYDRLSLRHCCRHHDIDGRSDRYFIQINVRTLQMIRLSSDQTMLNIYSGAQRTKALQVQIDRAASDITASGQCHLCLLIFTEQCTKQIIRCPDLLYILIITRHPGDRTSIDLYRMGIDPVNDSPDSFDRPEENIDVPHVGKIFNGNRFIRHDRRGKDRQRRILRTADLYFSN